MGKSSGPRPPDPQQTAAAQTGTNIGTAIANSQMGMVNQVTPDGTLTYSQSGTYEYKDPYTGKVYNLPKTTATTSLSEMGTQIKGQNDQTQLNMAQTGNQQSAFLKDYLGTPWNPDTAEIEGRLMELGSQRLDPRFAREEDQMRTRLANQGVTAGSEAWNREMGQLGETKNDAYNNLMLQGRGQAFNELGAIRNQPINEISALLNGSQVASPNVSMFQPQGAATTDVAGLINNNYNQQQQQWQQKQAGQQALLGGLFSAGSSLLMSDARLKEDIRRVGQTDAGLPIYTYRYKGYPAYHMGVMAQEAELTFPQAVHEVGGFKAVDYRGIA
jgi:Chaperone of endosialidase